MVIIYLGKYTLNKGINIMTKKGSIKKCDCSFWMGRKANAPVNWLSGPGDPSFGNKEDQERGLAQTSDSVP